MIELTTIGKLNYFQPQSSQVFIKRKPYVLHRMSHLLSRWDFLVAGNRAIPLSPLH